MEGTSSEESPSWWDELLAAQLPGRAEVGPGCPVLDGEAEDGAVFEVQLAQDALLGLEDVAVGRARRHHDQHPAADHGQLNRFVARGGDAHALLVRIAFPGEGVLNVLALHAWPPCSVSV